MSACVRAWQGMGEGRIYIRERESERYCEGAGGTEERETDLGRGIQRKRVREI